DVLGVGDVCRQGEHLLPVRGEPAQLPLGVRQRRRVAPADADAGGAGPQVGPRDLQPETLRSAGDQRGATVELAPHACSRRPASAPAPLASASGLPTRRYSTASRAPSESARKPAASSTSGLRIAAASAAAETSRYSGQGVQRTSASACSAACNG